MRTERLDFSLPKELIAQKPVRPRDAAKLLVLNKKSGKIEHSNFHDLTKFLKKGDLLVFNSTKVFPARIMAKKETSGNLEVVFLSEISSKVWEVVIGGKAEKDTKIIFSGDLCGEIIEKKGNIAKIKFNQNSEKILRILQKEGHMPLPPYIKRKDQISDKRDYQTVFAKKIGSAAAPTAGLHFTNRLLESLKNKGVEIELIDLHVGLGTFAPIKTEKIENHPIHAEYFEISPKTAQAVNRAKKEGRRVIAVGTTVVRTLETAYRNGKIQSGSGESSLFIYPDYKFKVIDGLITNFHTPHSSLLALVFAFAGEKNIKKAYRVAIRQKYRFFSYGDGMFII